MQIPLTYSFYISAECVRLQCFLEKTWFKYATAIGRSATGSSHFGKKKKEIRYRLTDEFSLFYCNLSKINGEKAHEPGKLYFVIAGVKICQLFLGWHIFTPRSEYYSEVPFLKTNKWPFGHNLRMRHHYFLLPAFLLSSISMKSLVRNNSILLIGTPVLTLR